MNMRDNTLVDLVYDPAGSALAGGAGQYVDMSRCTGVRFLATIGTAGATDYVSFKAFGSSSTSSTGTEIKSSTGSVVVATTKGIDNRWIELDIYKPKANWRYIKPHVVKHGNVLVFGGILAERYGLRRPPSTHGSTSLAGASTAESANGSAIIVSGSST